SKARTLRFAAHVSRITHHASSNSPPASPRLFINPPSTIHHQRIMAHQAIGLIETRGLVALVEGTDVMLKVANVELIGLMMQVGGGGPARATQQAASMNGRNLLLLPPQPVDEAGPTKLRPGAKPVVAVGWRGAGIGEMVLFTQARSARLGPGMKDAPVDAVII